MACDATRALAGVPTGSTKANEQDSVTDTSSRKGLMPSSLAICPEMGKKMVATVELLDISVANEARRLMMVTTRSMGSVFSWISFEPINLVRPVDVIWLANENPPPRNSITPQASLRCTLSQLRSDSLGNGPNGFDGMQNIRNTIRMAGVVSLGLLIPKCVQMLAKLV